MNGRSDVDSLHHLPRYGFILGTYRWDWRHNCIACKWLILKQSNLTLTNLQTYNTPPKNLPPITYKPTTYKPTIYKPTTYHLQTYNLLTTLCECDASPNKCLIL